MSGKAKFFLLVGFLTLFALHAVNLDGDPSPIKRMGDIGDEGYWQHNARCKVLFGTFFPDELNQAAIGAPLFTALQWASFSMFGVSFFTARLLPLVSFWCILLMLYILLRRSISTNLAVLAVTMLGVMHEMLMYVKWSTPIVPEMCFLTAILFFWEQGKKGNRFWMLLSGASLIAAAAIKLSAIYFAFSAFLFFVGAVWLRRETDRGRAMLFVLGAAIASSVLALFYWLNLAQFQVFAATIGKANISGVPGIRDIVYGFAMVLFNRAFQLPGICILVMLVSLRLFELAVQAIQHGWRTAICGLSTVEFYSLCWLVGCLAELAVSPDKADRRYVMLYIPLTILSASYAMQQLNRSADHAQRLHMATRIALLGLGTAAWYFYARSAVVLLSTHMFATSLPNWALAIVLTICAALAAQFFVFGRTRAVVVELLGVFFAVSLILDGLWYATATHTLRDTSRSLAERSDAGEFLVGPLGHELAMENRCLPIWPPWQKTIPMNQWFAKESENSVFLLLAIEKMDQISSNQETTWGPRFATPDRESELCQIKLCPDMAGSDNRLLAKLSLVRPIAATQGEVATHHPFMLYGTTPTERILSSRPPSTTYNR